MKWEKKGLIYCPNEKDTWRNNSFLTPQPFLLNDDVIRVYGAFRDRNGVGRIGYVDVNAKNPKEILHISEKPVLDIGAPGMFDDNGMILGDVIRVNDLIYMYYEGFQLVKNVKFLAFCGLAVSRDNGSTFERFQKTPIMDRSDEGVFGRCIHSVIVDEGVFKTWYAVVHDWTYINGVPYPTYYIKYQESPDGIHFAKSGNTCVRCGLNEYRIGRPKVRKTGSTYEMLFTYDTLQKKYDVGYASSEDGKSWRREDARFGINLSPGNEFDSDMVCYPAIVVARGKTYVFYDGNGMGKDGFGYAELIEE